MTGIPVEFSAGVTAVSDEVSHHRFPAAVTADDIHQAALQTP
jgi:hypothetical protein